VAFNQLPKSPKVAISISKLHHYYGVGIWPVPLNMLANCKQWLHHKLITIGVWLGLGKCAAPITT